MQTDYRQVVGKEVNYVGSKGTIMKGRVTECLDVSRGIVKIEFEETVNNSSNNNEGNGSIYEGEINEQLIPHGSGKFTFKKNFVYEGEVKDGQANGIGKITHVESGETYQGEWKDDKRDGLGVFSLPNVRTYKGGWKDDRYCGFGRQQNLRNGLIMEGEFDSQGRNGKFVEIDISCGGRYEGFYKNNLADGVWTIYSRTKEGKCLKKEVKFKNGQKESEGDEKEDGCLSLSEEEKRDKQFVLTKLSNDPLWLKFASPELRNDRTFVLEAVKVNKYSLKYAPEEFKNDREIVLEAIKFGQVLQFCHEDLRKDRDVVKKALENDGLALEYASEELKNDQETVLFALKNDCSSLKCASEDLKNSKEVVFQAVKSSGEVIHDFVGRKLKWNFSVLLEIAKVETRLGRLHNSKKYFSYALYRADEKTIEEILRVRSEINKTIDTERFEEDVGLLQRLGYSESVSKISTSSLSSLGINGKDSVSDFFPIHSGFPFYKRLMEIEEKDNEILSEVTAVTTLRQIIVNRELGSGAYGRTFLCKISGVRGNFVIKIFHNEAKSHEEKAEYAKRDFLKIPYHPNVVNVLSVTKEPQEIPLRNWGIEDDHEKIYSQLIFMKYYYMDLRYYIKQRNGTIDDKNAENKPKRPITIDEALFLLKGILEGSYHLHLNNIVHRDLHMGNIFVDPEMGRVWIGDFGCSLDLRGKSNFRVHIHDKMLKQTGSSSGIGGYNKHLPQEVQKKWIQPSNNSNSSTSEESHDDVEEKQSDETRVIDNGKDIIDFEKCDLFSCGLIGYRMLGIDRGKTIIPKEELENVRKCSIIPLFSFDIQIAQIYDNVVEGLTQNEPTDRISYSKSLFLLEQAEDLYQKKEKSGKNLKVLAKNIGLRDVVYDIENRTAVLQFDDTSILFSENAQFQKIFMYSPLLESLPKEKVERLELYEKLLSGTKVGEMTIGGGIGVSASVDEEAVLYHNIHDISRSSEDHLRFCLPYIKMVEAWIDVCKVTEPQDEECEGEENGESQTSVFTEKQMKKFKEARELYYKNFQEEYDDEERRMSKEIADAVVKSFGLENSLVYDEHGEHGTCEVYIENMIINMSYDPLLMKLYLSSPVLTRFTRDEDARIKLYEIILTNNIMGVFFSVIGGALGGVGLDKETDSLVMHFELDLARRELKEVSIFQNYVFTFTQMLKVFKSIYEGILKEFDVDDTVDLEPEDEDLELYDIIKEEGGEEFDEEDRCDPRTSVDSCRSILEILESVGYVPERRLVGIIQEIEERLRRSEELIM